MGLAVLLFAVASVAHAQNPITVEDIRRVETDGTWTTQVPLSLPAPSFTGDVTVDWTLFEGSARDGTDFTVASGTVTFTELIHNVRTIDVEILGDVVDEWNPFRQQDEEFYVVLSSPSANATLAKGRATVTIIDDDRDEPGVNFLNVVTGSGLMPDEATLQWRIPGATVAPNDVVIRWDVGPACTFPTSTTGGGSGTGGIVVGAASGMGQKQATTVSGLATGQNHCFSVFAMYGASPTTEIAQAQATPFDGAAGPVAWRSAIRVVNVVPPAVGADAIYTVDNGGVVHAMRRGTGGFSGIWPGAWQPVSVGKPPHNRSAVVPVNGDWTLFVGCEEGCVYAVDGSQGTVRWARSTRHPNTPPLPHMGVAQAQPAGIFTAYGGQNDMILVGTNASGGSNAFYALDPFDGSDIDIYPDPLMGAVTGMAVVDYAANRVYFVTNAPGRIFYALDLGPAGAPGLTLSALPGGNPRTFGSGSNGSAVLRGDRVVLGDTGGLVHGLDLTTGAQYSAPTSDGQVKGFLWPDRRDDRLYFSTNGKVHAWQDTGSTFAPIWSIDVTTPSIVLQKPGTDYIYVGDGNGRLIQIDVVTEAQTPLLLEGPGVQIGAPSLDSFYGLVLVGSSTGTIHAVRVPF